MKRTYAQFLPGILLILLTAFSSQAQPLIASVTTTSSCQNNGTLTVTLNQGAGPYYYYLFTGSRVSNYDGQSINASDYNYYANPTVIGPISQNTYTFTNLKNGGYMVYGSSGNNSSFSENEYAKVDAVFEAALTFVQGDCHGLNGSITATPSGGIAPYTYHWNNGTTTSSFALSANQTATLAITDANGCVFNSVDSMTVHPSFDFSLNLTTTPFGCNTPATATVSVTGPTDTYSYSWNTIPIQTTATATISNDGYYQVVVTNSTGCSQQDTLYMNHGINAFALQVTQTEATCLQADGSISITPSGGTAPYTYAWSNGETTAALNNLLGNTPYNVIVKDDNGCTATANLYVTKTSPLNVSYTVNNVACSTNGSITANVTNGLEPYTYSWGNGATTATITAPFGGYYLEVTDANGCELGSGAYIPQDSVCQVYISGSVYFDVNENGIRDNGEQGIYTTVSATSSSYQTLTAPYDNGYYTLIAPADQYVLSVVIPANWQISPASSANLSINATSNGQVFTQQNFGLIPATIASDVTVSAYTGSQRPGYAHSAYLFYTNVGTQTESGTIEFTISEGWEIEYSSPVLSSYDSGLRKATWNYSDLQSLESGIIYLSMYVPIDVTLGTVVSGEATISSTQTDMNLSNNTSSCSTYVQNSYDPNEMQVSPQGTGAEGYITESEDELAYKIDFQNTGTAEAYNIQVTNDLDDNLDASTFVLLNSSHNCAPSLKNGKLTFDFRNINLPDSNHNEPQSHGYLIYKIKRKTGLAPETQIHNSANIYFDYNTPVATNQVLNTTARTTASVSADQTSNDVALYPNPSNNQFSIRFNALEESAYSIQLYSAAGQEMPLAENLQATAGINTAQLSLASLNLPNGLYVVKLVVGTKSYTRNLMLSR
ncbi:MAG: hypothetical protein JWO58_2392 [Chitinophagaceae bacterium]|nr:hypothetical protein [Chitinophagaceae bacterium]